MNGKILINKILDFLFPVQCLGCRLPSCHLCGFCLEKIKRQSSFQCAFCNQPTAKGRTCWKCRPQHDLDYLWAAADYDQGLLKNTLHAYKYRFISELADPLSDLLLKYLNGNTLASFLLRYQSLLTIVPVPLHFRRQRWRSYNQSLLLAQRLAEQLKLSLAEDVLKRTRYQKPQTEAQTPEARKKNIDNSFTCDLLLTNARIKDRFVLLIDDVSTTGATLDACAKTLKEAGAKKVIGLVIAKG